jgi:hypothetical protein
MVTKKIDRYPRLTMFCEFGKIETVEFLLVFSFQTFFSKLKTMKKNLPQCLVGISMFALLLFAFSVTGQEAAKANGERLQLEKAESNRPIQSELKIEKKITGRLPVGYKNVVKKSQIDEIHNIQREYAEIIERLKLRIELLEQECDKQVDALLEPEQVQKIREANGALESEKHLLKKEDKPKRPRSKPAEEK